MTGQTMTLGRPPIINLIVATDYGDPMSVGGKAGEGFSSLTVHLEIPVTLDEAASLHGLLANRRHSEAQRIAEIAMGRAVHPSDPAGRNCRALVAAAFAP
jgi:hypothetical protein